MIAILGLAGCGSIELFGAYDLPEDQQVTDTPWPKLVDTPSAPAPGNFSAEAPDPANGNRTQADLATAAVYAEGRAKALSGPVITDQEKARMLKNAARKQP